MALNDPLAAMLSKIENAGRVNKSEVHIKPVSKLLIQVLDILVAHSYIKGYDVVEDGKGKYVVVKGIEQVNKCGAIKPRFSFQATDGVLVEQQYLPSRGFGIVIVTTSKGLMTIDKAIQEHLGGKLVAYCY